MGERKMQAGTGDICHGGHPDNDPMLATKQQSCGMTYPRIVAAILSLIPPVIQSGDIAGTCRLTN